MPCSCFDYILITFTDCFNHSLTCSDPFASPPSACANPHPAHTHTQFSPLKPSQVMLHRYWSRQSLSSVSDLRAIGTSVRPSVSLSCVLYNCVLTWYLLTVLAPVQSCAVTLITRTWSAFDLSFIHSFIFSIFVSHLWFMSSTLTSTCTHVWCSIYTRIIFTWL